MTRRRLVATFAVAGAAATAGALFWAWPVRPRSGTPRAESRAKAPPQAREDPRKKLRERYEREAAGISREDLAKRNPRVDPAKDQEILHRHIAALYSPDRDLRMLALRTLCYSERDVAPNHTVLEPLLELADRREGVERALLLYASWLATWSLPTEGAAELRRRGRDWGRVYTIHFSTCLGCRAAVE